MQLPIKRRDFVGAFEIEYVTPLSADTLRFKIEIYSSANLSNGAQFSARVFRYDLFRINALLPSEQLADHDIMVLDPSFGILDLEAQSFAEASNCITKKICDQMGCS